MSGSGGGGVGVNLRNSVTSNADVVGKGGNCASGAGSVSSKTLPTSDRSQRQNSLRKRYSGGDATDLAVNVSTNFNPFGGVDGNFDSGLRNGCGGGGGGAMGGGNSGLTNSLMATNAALLPPGWQTMTNWRNQMTPLTISTTTTTNMKSAATQNSTPPPPLPAKLAGNAVSSPFMSNFSKGNASGGSGANFRHKYQ